MIVRDFSLIQFPSSGIPPLITVSGSIRRGAKTLLISYELAGPLAKLSIPVQTDIPLRKIGLWEETCFEFFLAAEGSDSYREFNLSPAGHWNVYRFSSYRKDMEEEQAFASLPFSIQREADSLGLFLELDLDNITLSDQALKIGISAVVKTADGTVSYWALTHPAPKADFHRRDSFLLDL